MCLQKFLISSLMYCNVNVQQIIIHNEIYVFCCKPVNQCVLQATWTERKTIFCNAHTIILTHICAFCGLPFNVHNINSIIWVSCWILILNSFGRGTAWCFEKIQKCVLVKFVRKQLLNYYLNYSSKSSLPRFNLFSACLNVYFQCINYSFIIT